MAAVMSALIWYILPGLIGRSFDLKNSTFGPDIFSKDDVAKGRVIEQYMTTSEYKLITDSLDAEEFLDVSGDLSLKIKTGNVKVSGVGNYLKNADSFKNKIELLVKVHYETVSITLPSDVKPLANWQDMIGDTGVTHYVRSIVYGGDLIATLSFTADNAHDLEYIKGEIQGEMGAASGAFSGSLKGSLERIKNKTRETASMAINYYATVPLETIPKDIDTLVELVEKFPNQTMAVNKGTGVPIRMEVFSLESLSRDKTTYYNRMSYENMLDIMNDQLTDIRTARTRLSNWMQSIPPLLSEEMKKKISIFATKLDEISKVYSGIIDNLDLSSDKAIDQFTTAFDAYKDGQKYTYPNMYVNRLSELKVEVYSNTPALEGDFGGAIYTYWGKRECPSDSDTTSSGTMYSPIKESVGTTRFLCLPEEPDYIPVTNKNEDTDIDDLPQIVPTVFVSQGNAKTQDYKVDCSQCRIPGKSAVTMLPGKNSCPSGWTKQYDGVLVTTELLYSSRGELICLDVNQDLQTTEKTKESMIITEATTSCDNFPCSVAGASDSKTLSCVVCSIKKQSKSVGDVFLF